MEREIPTKKHILSKSVDSEIMSNECVVFLYDLELLQYFMFVYVFLLVFISKKAQGFCNNQLTIFEWDFKINI